MSKKWNIEDLDTCYRQSVNSFEDGFDHAQKQGIPRFIEEYRLSRVKDAIAPWIVGEKKVLEIRHEALGEGTGNQSQTEDRRPKTEDGPKVLDLGCGHGWYCFRLIDKWGLMVILPELMLMKQ